MDYVTVSQLLEKPSEFWRRVEAGEEFVVTRNGKPFALLVHIKPTGVEDRLRAIRLSRIAELARVIKEDAQADSPDQLTDEDVQAEITDAGSERRTVLSTAPSAGATAPPPTATEQVTRQSARDR